MIRIEAIFVGEPKSITDEKGTWLSAVNTGDNWELENRFNEPVSVSLVNQAAYRGLEPDDLDRVMRAKGVVPEWKEILQRRAAERR